MKQSFAKFPRDPLARDVVPTLPMLLVLAVDATEPRNGGQGTSRAPWVMRLVLESLQGEFQGMSPKYFDAAHRAGRGIVDVAVQPITEKLVETGHLVPVGVGASATWSVGDARRAEVDELWRSVPPAVARAARTAGQCAAAMAVALSKTARASTESSVATSTS